MAERNIVFAVIVLVDVLVASLLWPRIKRAVAEDIGQPVPPLRMGLCARLGAAVGRACSGLRGGG